MNALGIFARRNLGHFVGAALLLTLPFAARAEDWPRWRGPDLNGITREKGWATRWPSEGPRQVWKAAVGTGFSSVAVSEGRLFTLGNKEATDTVYCLDAASGKPLWTHSYPCPLDPKYYEGGPGSTPTVEAGRVYTLSKRGHLFCFNIADGKPVWEKDLIAELGVRKPEWGFSGSPLVDGDLLVLNVGGAGTGVEKGTGKVAWRSDTNAAGYATPVPYTAEGKRCAILFSGKSLVAVRAEDGRELWRYPWVTKWDINASEPILVGTKLFVSTFDRGCALLELASGKPIPIWQNKNMANHFNGCVVMDNLIFGMHGNTDQALKELRCLDFGTGEIKWRHEGFGLGALCGADGKLLILGDRGQLAVADPSAESFKPLAQAQVMGGKCWTVPVLANGKIYCRNAEGTLICLDVSKKGVASK